MGTTKNPTWRLSHRTQCKKVLLMKHSVENGVKKLLSPLPVTKGRGNWRVVEDLGSWVDGDSQMTLKWSEVPLSPATGQGPGLV